MRQCNSKGVRALRTKLWYLIRNLLIKYRIVEGGSDRKKLITGRHGQVRGASPRLPPKNGQPTTLQRQLQHLYPLEITQSEYLTSRETPQHPKVTQPRRIYFNYPQDQTRGPPQELVTNSSSCQNRSSKALQTTI